MDSYDHHEHAAKRQRTDEGRDRQDRGYGQDNFNSNYNYNNRGGRSQEEEKPNHILLITIINPSYPITVDVIHTICSPNGKVLRIVIFKKNGVQAMVEFDCIESATRAKESLNGADIYSGCCTLKIEYAKPTRLNVYKNDNDSWDYSNPNLGKLVGKPPGNERPALLQEPRGFPHGGYRNDQGRNPSSAPAFSTGSDRGDSYDNYGNPGGPRNMGGGYGNNDHYGPPGGGPQERYGGPPPPSERFGRFGSGRDCFDEGPNGPGGPGGRYNSMGGPPPPGGVPQQGAVMMVYGLSPKEVNCEKLFNLFCLYGNVVRIKFLKSKEGCAMVQLGDGVAVERCISNLNNASFFNGKMQLKFSKQAFLNDVQQPFELPDGTPSFKDYMGNRNNRFTNPNAAGKNRILAPSKTLHFFNTPYGLLEDDLQKIFSENKTKEPKSIKLFPSKSNSERSSSGLIEFDSISDALEGLVLCNHVAIPNPSGKFPYILKLCFSSTGPRF